MPSWSALVLCWQNENSPGCASKTKLSKWLTKLFTLTNTQSRSRRQNLPGILSQRPQTNNVICSIVNSWKSQTVTIWRVPYSSAKAPRKQISSLYGLQKQTLHGYPSNSSYLQDPKKFCDFPGKFEIGCIFWNSSSSPFKRELAGLARWLSW